MSDLPADCDADRLQQLHRSILATLCLADELGLHMIGAKIDSALHDLVREAEWHLGTKPTLVRSDMMTLEV